jgi:DNA repair exonuclease SbcCD ATPase subunit
MESKQTLEEKDFEISQLKSRLQSLSEEYSNMFSEKEKGDQDLQELIVEYSSFRDKMDKLTLSKDNQLAELKRKLDLRGLSASQDGNANIPERDEEIEELREKLESKDKIINDLRARGDRSNASSLQVLDLFIF